MTRMGRLKFMDMQYTAKQKLLFKNRITFCRAGRYYCNISLQLKLLKDQIISENKVADNCRR